MPLYIVLVVFLLALSAALIHPLALLLRVLPIDAEGTLEVLSAVRSYAATFLFWGILSLLGAMAAVIAMSRFGKHKVGSSHEAGAPLAAGEPETLASQPKIAVAITAYNEADVIAQVVRDFKAQDDVVEVIVVDNNSSDGTADLASATGAKVVRESRQGYGYACLRGLTEALSVSEADVIVLTEGDGTFAGADLKKFQAYVPNAEMVLGTRVVPGLVETGSQMDHFFTWGNLVISALLRLRFWDMTFLGAARLSDVGCTYRAIRREALERILPDLVVGGNNFSPHMMLVALCRKISIVEIPVSFYRRVGESKGASQSLWKGLEVGLSMVWHIVIYRPPPERAPAKQTGMSPQLKERS